MANEGTAPVYELFAALGLDLSRFDDGLLNSRIKLEQFEPHIVSLNDLIESLGLNATEAQKAMQGLWEQQQSVINQVRLGVEAEAAQRAQRALFAKLDAGEMAQRKADLEAYYTAEQIRVDKNYTQGLIMREKFKAYDDFKAQYEQELRDESWAAEEAMAAKRVALAKETAVAEAASRTEYSNLVKGYQAQELADARAVAIEKIRLEAESVVATREAASNRKAVLAQEVAARAEYTQLVQGYQAEELAAAKVEMEEELAARRRYVATWQILLRERDAADASLIGGGVLSPGRAATVLGGWSSSSINSLGARGSAIEIQAAQQIFGLEGIHRGLTSVLARIPEVQTAMMGLFSVFAAVAFVEVLSSIGKKLIEITADMNGFGEADKKAWADALTGSIAAQNALIKYRDTQDAIDNGGQQNATKNAERIEIELVALREQLKVTEAIVDQQDKIRDAIKQTGGLSTPFDKWAQIAQLDLMDKLKGIAPQEERDKLDKLRAQIFDLSSQKGENLTGSQMDRARLFTPTKSNIETLKENWAIEEREYEQHLGRYEAAATREQRFKLAHAEYLKKLAADEKLLNGPQGAANKRLRDEVHELPYRLPWFMGTDPAGSFEAQMGMSGGPRRAASSIMATDALGRPVPPPRMPTAVGGGSGAAAPGQGRSSGVPVTVQVTNNYAPVFKFDGIPGDVERFMREKAEPQLINDMQQNSRGVTKQILDVLKKNGVDVHAG